MKIVAFPSGIYFRRGSLEEVFWPSGARAKKKTIFTGGPSSHELSRAGTPDQSNLEP